MFAAIDNNSTFSFLLVVAGILLAVGGSIYSWRWCADNGRGPDSFFVAHAATFGSLFAGGILYLFGCRLVGIGIRTGRNGRVLHFLADKTLPLFLVALALGFIVWMINIQVNDRRTQPTRNQEFFHGLAHVLIAVCMAAVFIGLGARLYL